MFDKKNDKPRPFRAGMNREIYKVVSSYVL